jgi:hypothetical protein
VKEQQLGNAEPQDVVYLRGARRQRVGQAIADYGIITDTTKMN